MKTKRARFLLPFACLLLLAATAAPAHATSVFRNTVEADGYTNDPFHQRSDSPTLIQPFTFSNDPWTVFHPDPLHGFASSQGVSALTGDGSGLAVHARADLAPGAGFTRSKAVAAIEFEIVDPSTATQVPVDVSFIGNYLTAGFGSVQAFLWRGLANTRGTSGNAPQLIFSVGGTAGDAGIWNVERSLLTRQTYTLELNAIAGVFDGFNTSAVAFLDPVIHVDLGPGVDAVIRFDSAATLQNSAFIAPVPEPTPLLYGAGLAFVWSGSRTRRRASAP